MKDSLARWRYFLYCTGVTTRSFAIMPESLLKLGMWEYSKKKLSEKGYNEKSSWICAGAAAGVITTLVNCPSEFLMIQVQASRQGLEEVLARQRQRGMHTLYSGFRPALIRDVTFNAAFFTLRSWGIQFYQRKYDQQCSKGVKLAIGWGAGKAICKCSVTFKYTPYQWAKVCWLFTGGVATTIACPFDVIKTRIQSATGDSHDGFMTTMSKVMRQGRWKLMSGVGPRLIVIPVSMSTILTLSEWYQEQAITVYQRVSI